MRPPLFFDVVLPPELSKKRAIAKLIGNSLQRVGGFECPHTPGPPAKQAQGAKLNCFLIRTICIGLSAYL